MVSAACRASTSSWRTRSALKASGRREPSTRVPSTGGSSARSGWARSGTTLIDASPLSRVAASKTTALPTSRSVPGRLAWSRTADATRLPASSPKVSPSRAGGLPPAALQALATRWRAVAAVGLHQRDRAEVDPVHHGAGHLDGDLGHLVQLGGPVEPLDGLEEALLLVAGLLQVLHEPLGGDGAQDLARQRHQQPLVLVGEGAGLEPIGDQHAADVAAAPIEERHRQQRPQPAPVEVVAGGLHLAVEPHRRRPGAPRRPAPPPRPAPRRRWLSVAERHSRRSSRWSSAESR